MLALFVILILAILPHPIYANYDPLSVPNNRYGIHIVDTNDIADLPALVNSTGGDWGYVTMVLSDSDGDHDRWQNIFNQMRRLHLIPIVRLATHMAGTGWVKPDKDRFHEIVQLLNSLNWPTQNRYVILYNEPNHAAEWGGTVDPQDYARTFVDFAKQLKTAHEDFFVLPAGLDASSIDDEAEFLSRMAKAEPEIFSFMDGWTSHSYPNPGFSGSPYATGRGTLTTYQWELSYLRSLGLSRQLPVFITETGWQHNEGKTYIPSLLSADQVGFNLQIAAQNIWSDPRVTAVTPFIFNYQDIPFDHFSWKKLGTDSYYPHYFAYQSMPKIKGAPKQRESYTLQSGLLPKSLVAGSTYTLFAQIKNDGQGIIDPKDGYELLVTAGGTMTVFIDPLPVVEPGDTGTLTVHLKTPQQTGRVITDVALKHNDENILLQHEVVTLVPPPSIEVHAHLGWRKTSDASDVSVLIYDKDTLIQKISGLTMKKGAVSASGLTDIIPGNTYRVVTLVRGYLPRQTISALEANSTALYPDRFLPLDFNNDGTFTFADVFALVRISPWVAITRFFGP